MTKMGRFKTCTTYFLPVPKAFKINELKNKIVNLLFLFS